MTRGYFYPELSRLPDIIGIQYFLDRTACGSGD
jgi:hypothetical protein